MDSIVYSNLTLEEMGTPEEGPFPQGLLSLWDMLRFYAALFSKIIQNLEFSRSEFLLSSNPYSTYSPNWEKLEKDLAAVAKGVEDLCLSLSLKEQVSRIRERATDHSRDNTIIIGTLISELSKNIISEISEHLFLIVPSELKWLYLNPEKILGPEFEAAFPDAIKDMYDGVRCFALDQWTASVFHFMRVLEYGIRQIAENVGLNLDNLVLENWKNILDQIEKKIRELEQLPKSQEKSTNLTYFSEAASNFRYFKDAWRNHVSHSRVNYDSRDARRVMDHVIDFMQHLAKKISS